VLIQLAIETRHAILRTLFESSVRFRVDVMMTINSDISGLRERHYNATVDDRIDVIPGLAIFRIRPDVAYPAFMPGQYTVLGLLPFEPRADGVPTDPEAVSSSRSHSPLIRRAYSISCPVLDEREQLVCCRDIPFVEFYVALISRDSDHPPMLTPRIFGLSPGSRIHLGPRACGRYTLASVKPTDDVAFFATGTGEAPHNAMIPQLLSQGHSGRVVSVVCARQQNNLAYLACHRELERRYPNYRYITLTTREPINTDPEVAGYVGKQYLQDIVSSGRFESDLGYRLTRDSAHIFLCGNPAMVGAPHRAPDGHLVFPELTGMVEIFAHRGFAIGGASPQVHFEKYW
jgi:ferredoxin--NADP+ reductase